MKSLPKVLDGYKQEIHKWSDHYSVGYWKNGKILHFHGGVLLFKDKYRQKAIEIMKNYLEKIGTKPAVSRSEKTSKKE